MQSELERLVYAAASQPNGLDTSKVPGYTTEQVGHVVGQVQNKFCKAKLGERTVRYFLEQKDADAYMLKHGPHSSETRKKTPGRDTPAYRVNQEAVETERTVRDIRPTPDCLVHHRYWVDPASIPRPKLVRGKWVTA